MDTGVVNKGGRPPQGPKSGKGATLATRITAETRQALDEEAMRTGRSVSQVAEIWLDEARNGRAQYQELLGGSAELAAAIEKLVEIARTVDIVVPFPTIRHVALMEAWREAAPALVSRPAITPEVREEIRQFMAAWTACSKVSRLLDTPEHAHLKKYVSILSGDPNSTSIQAPDVTVRTALEDLLEPGPARLRPEIEEAILDALELVKEAVEYKRELLKRVDWAKTVGRQIAISAIGVQP